MKFLYCFLRFMNDLKAILTLDGRRVGRKAAGRAFGRGLRRFFSIALLLLLISCGSSSGGSGDSSNPLPPPSQCYDLPIPCLDEDWGESAFHYEKVEGSELIEAFSILAQEEDGSIHWQHTVLEGEELRLRYFLAEPGGNEPCLYAELFYGAELVGQDWIPLGVNGSFRLCDEQMTFSDIVINNVVDERYEGLVLEYSE